MSDELLDIVDEHDRVIGQMMRSEVYRNKMSNFRAVNAFLINDKGELWIPRRVASKKLFPLALDASVAGHVGAGETYEQAFERELMEETGLDLNAMNWKYIGPMTPHEHGTSAFIRLYVIYTNETPIYNTQDFCESFWIHPQELLERLAEGEKHKSDLPLMVKWLLSQEHIRV